MRRFRVVGSIIILLIVGVGLFWLGSELTRPLPPTPTITPTPVPTKVGGGNGLIAFTSERNGNSEIYVMNADGSNQRNLTQNEAWDAMPAWSPDGKQIAFISNRLSESSEVFIMQADGSNVQPLTNNTSAQEVLWSSSGQQFLISQATLVNGNLVVRLFLVQADGTMQPLTLPEELSNAICHSLEWSPDGTQVAVLCVQFSTPVLYIIPLNGNSATKVDVRVEAFAWSPDGAKLAWISSGKLWLADADGKAPRLLRENLGGLYSELLLWSLDGSRLLISNLDDRQQQRLLLMWADGSALTQLPIPAMFSSSTDFSPLRGAFTWSPNSQWVAFTDRLEGLSTVYALNIAEAFRYPTSLKPVQLTTSGADYGPRWQPQP